MQYFFTKHYTDDVETELEDQHELACATCTSLFDSFDGDLKVHMIPQARNKILIRLENIADLFDGTPAQTPYFDLQTYAEELFSHSNGGKKATSVQITERTLGNNQDYAEMEEAKFHWKSTDPASTIEWPEDKDTGEVALQPQRIRLFRVLYTVAEAEPAIQTFL